MSSDVLLGGMSKDADESLIRPMLSSALAAHKSKIMSAIQTCLSRFAVQLWSPAPDWESRVQEAVVAYLQTFGRDRASQLAAIETLRGCFGNMNPSNPVADGVRALLDRMTHALSDDVTPRIAA